MKSSIKIKLGREIILGKPIKTPFPHLPNREYNFFHEMFDIFFKETYYFILFDISKNRLLIREGEW